MTDSLSARIAEAKARAKERQAFYNLCSHSLTDLVAADVLFLADHAAEQAAQLARAHAVIKAAREAMTKWLIVAPIHRPECNPLHGCTCGKTEAYDQTIAAMALLADFDRGEQG